MLAAGYPYFNESQLQQLRPVVTSGHVNNVSPSMLQTSCCVQSGFRYTREYIRTCTRTCTHTHKHTVLILMAVRCDSDLCVSD